MTNSADVIDARTAPRSGRRFPSTLLGVGPFIAFAVLFLLLPAIALFVGAFQKTGTSTFTLDNFVNLAKPYTAAAYEASIEISLVTAVAAGIFGFFLAYAVIAGGLPSPIRTGIMTFAGVASNFAGVPLSLAFIFTIGRTGFITVILSSLGFDMRSFSIYTKIGLEIVYLYFQLPLMVLIIAPAIDGLKKEWREASENLGASNSQYWRHIALPVLLPSILGSVILLFGNAFGAQATAFALTGGFIPLVTIVIGGQLSGDTLGDRNLGFALAVGMVAIMGVTLLAYTWLARRAERWQR